MDAGTLPKETLAALNDLLWALPATLDAGAIVGVVLEKAAKLFDAPLACVWLREGDQLSLFGCYGFTAKKGEQLAERLGLTERSPVAFSLSGPTLHALTSFGKRRLGSLLAAPLTAPGGEAGWLVLARFEPTAFTEIEEHFLTILAGRVGAALESARLYQEARDRTRELELLNEVAQLLVSTVKLDELLERIVRRISETFRLTGCMISLTDPETHMVLVRALHFRGAMDSERLTAFFRNRPLRSDTGRTAEILKEGRPYLASNLQDDPAVASDVSAELGPGALVAVPLMLRGTPIGIMYGFRAGRTAPFRPEDLPLLTHLGAQIAIAIDNAQLYAEMERRAAPDPGEASAAHEAALAALERLRAGGIGPDHPGYAELVRSIDRLARLAGGQSEGR